MSGVPPEADQVSGNQKKLDTETSVILDTVGRMVPLRGFIRHQVWTQILVGSTLLMQERSDLRF